MKTVVHVTHEAVEKIGGIGAVLEGLITSKAYDGAVDRTILVCPLFTKEGAAKARLGIGGEVLYSSVDGIIRNEWAGTFRHVEEQFGVGIVYGRRVYYNPDNGVRVTPEVLLVDLSHISARQVNHFKGQLWEHFHIDSIRYEHCWDYEQWVKLAPPALSALESLGAVPNEEDGQCIIVAHEFMGMPTALGAIMSPHRSYRTVFYAHEVATIRKIVEEHPGHDTMFYNALSKAHSESLYLDDVFGSQDHYYKHALVSAARHCDALLAVGDFVVKELKFLAPEFESADVSLCYNGIPFSRADLQQRLHSKAKLQRYCEILLDYRPDYIFTHVSRMTVSKALWRDLSVLEHIERAFRQQDKTAVLYMLTTELPRRRREDVLHMEKWWRWPVAHREVAPDLSGGEATLYAGIQEFNAKARNVKVVFVNQFGFDPQTCGTRMPADMETIDIHRGSDVEFGQSVYEPFGIAMLEPLTFGGICVVSNVCGHVGFVQHVCGEHLPDNVIVADYTQIDEPELTLEEAMQIDHIKRHQLEQVVARRVAERVLRVLPRDNTQVQKLIDSGYDAASHMGWENVSREYFLPVIERICARRHAPVLQTV
jgi:hypothetical protein